MLTLLITGCVASTEPSRHNPRYVDHPEDYIPPRTTEMDIKLWDCVVSEPRVISVEEERQNYEASISKISMEIADEKLQMRMCLEVHTEPSDRYCQDLLKHFCQVDQMVDIRGNIHRKEYCSENRALPRKRK